MTTTETTPQDLILAAEFELGKPLKIQYTKEYNYFLLEHRWVKIPSYNTDLNATHNLWLKLSPEQKGNVLIDLVYKLEIWSDYSEYKTMAKVFDNLPLLFPAIVAVLKEGKK